MKVAVAGIGRMGQAICYAMCKLGHQVVGLDSNPEAGQVFRKYISASDGVFYGCGERDYKDILTNFEAPEVLISSLPYHQNLPLAEFCVDRGIRYCDLGGRVDVSKQINQYAEEHATRPVMTDLGLAPGWVNILAEWGYKEIQGVPERVEMMVGGLPSKPVNHPLDYVVTWSVDGLINEYRDRCEILEGGKIITVDGMDGHEAVKLKCMRQEMEAFYTSGGASHTIHDMKSRGVKDCHYKTIRYKGHCDAVKFLIRKCKLSDDCLFQIFSEGCRQSDEDQDIVIIKTELKKGALRWKKEILVESDGDFSAMQRATAFPIAAVASLMGEGIIADEIRNNDSTSCVLSYKDIPFDAFNSRLEKLGLTST
jgi:saccharopine dehydrogenase-like NADP-dependent oxidoreductase